MKKTILTLTVAMSFNVFGLKVDAGSTPQDWRVDGKPANAVEATKAALNGQKVLKCRGKKSNGKIMLDASGNTVGQVVECTPQELVINPKSGGTKFKAIKN